MSYIFLLQDTIRSPPAENKQMKKATLISISTTTFFYMSVAIAGYAAFGDNAPGNLLTGFSTPYWLVDIANTCIVIHLVGAYQVYSQSYYTRILLSFHFYTSMLLSFHLYTHILLSLELQLNLS
jgi:amino acid permease